MFCMKCGAQQGDEAIFCGKCGSKILREPDLTKPVESVVPDSSGADRVILERAPTLDVDTTKANFTAEPSSLENLRSEETTAAFGLMSSTVLFVAAYLLCMLPTYYLPYVGSNSTLVQGMSAAVSGRTMGSFWIHLA